MDRETIGEEVGCKREEKEERDQCHTAESLLWRGERDGSRTGRTNRWRADKKKGEAGKRERQAFLSPDEKKRGYREREITERTEERKKEGCD